jgi:hypothetical protein
MKEGPPNAKQAVVAGADATWRKIMGRSLHHGGFTVRFAQSADEIAVDARVVVAADDLLPAGALVALADARAHGSTAAWVLVVPPKGVAAANAQTASLGGASTVDGFGPPENALFVVNELLAGRAVNQRASPRLLYGTTIAFRAAGRDEDEVGFSYNVSAGGLYVRTLAPLEPGDETWLEMWSPRSERRVRLLGTVAWRRAFGPTGGATVPPGFGVKITGGLGEDWERWVAGCQRFADNLGLSVPPPPTSEP